MKHLTTTMCMVLLTLFAATSYSQKRSANKPFLFTNFPTSISCSEAQLNSLFMASKGQSVNVTLANNFALSGPVTNNQVKYSNLQTIIIKLPAFNNTLFSLSKQTDQNNNKTFVGRILNPLYADGFELQRNPDGNYSLIKIDLEKIVVTCNQ
ncbi:MAG: hypothetical protein ABIS69_10405 [Sediminibacterium sp.]